MKVVWWIEFIGKAQDGVFEGQEGARVHVELEVKVNRTTTPVFGVQVNFPRLAKGVGLDEVSLVVNMKSVGYSVVF